MSELSKIAGRGVYVAGNDIDTDRIIPARFLKCVTFDELGPSLFFDERFDATGESKDHPLDASHHKGASILISDANFGCGSSREHAPQAIQKFGIKVVIAESFAEIFHGNCTTLGIPCLQMAAGPRSKLARLIDAEPGEELMVDLEALQVVYFNQSLSFSMKPSAREAFLTGTFDPLDELLVNREAISAVDGRLSA